MEIYGYVLKGLKMYIPKVKSFRIEGVDEMNVLRMHEWRKGKSSEQIESINFILCTVYPNSTKI